MTGQKLGGYEILGELGRGGMGVVYRARQLSLNRDVALKILPAHQALDATRLERFRREGAAVARIAHPNLVQIVDVGFDAGVHFIAMEFVPGCTVTQLLQDGGALTHRDAVRIAAQVASALGAIHVQGLIHRDVKPSNILVTPDRHAKLTDFGVAGLVEEADGPQLTMAQAAVGTPQYMSPEQARGQGGVGGASDVYSLGMVLYEMLAGRHPFGDVAPMEAMAKVLHEPMPPIRRFRPDIPDDLALVLDRCLEKAAEDRFASGNELAAALEKIRLRLEMAAMESGDAGTGTATSSSASPVTGTGLFYVDPVAAQTGRRLGRARAILDEAIVQITDPNRRQRRELARFSTRSMAARDAIRTAEKELSDLRKRQQYHADKAARYRTESQGHIEAGRSAEAEATAEQDRQHQKVALDYEHRTSDLAARGQALRSAYAAQRAEHNRLADALALLDAEARGAGRPIPSGREDPRLARQASWLRYAGAGVLLALMVAGLMGGLAVRPQPPPMAEVLPAPEVKPIPAVNIPSLEQGLVLFYDFNSNLQDKGPGGNHATMIGQPTFRPVGAGYGIYFDNPAGGAPATTMVLAPYTAAIQALETSSVTIALRYASDDNAVDHSNGRVLGSWSPQGPGVVLNYNSADPRTYVGQIAVGDGIQKFILRDTSNPLSNVADGNQHWQFLIIDRDRNEIQMHVDTNRIKTTVFSSLGSVCMKDLVIGAVSLYPQDDTKNCYAARKTLVDELRIYNRALSAEEIRSLVAVGGSPEPLR